MKLNGWKMKFRGKVNSLLVSRSITPLLNGDQRIVQESQRPRLDLSEEGFWAGFWKGSFTDMDVER